MEERERQLLVARTAAAGEQTMRMRWVFGLENASLMMLLVAAGGIIERDSRARERARRTVAQSEERFHLALDSAKAGAWEWDLATNENIWSEELWGLYGLAPHSVPPSYDAWREIIHPDDRASAERVVQKAARAETELNVEFRVRGLGGAERWLLAQGRPFRNGNGHPVRYAGIVMDITPRKHADDEMLARNATIHAIGRVFSEAISCETEETLGRACLKIAENLTASKFGVIGEIGAAGRLDDIGIDDIGISDPAASLATREICDKVVRHGKAFYTNRPGSHPEAFLGVPLIRAEKVIGMIGVGNRDNGYGPRELESLEAVAPAIVQALLHKRAETALRNSSEQRRLAIEAAALGAWDYRFETGDVFWDDPCRNMFGFPAGSRIDYDEAVSRIHCDEREAVREALDQALAGVNGGVYNTEFRVVWPDGSVHWIVSHGRVHLDKDGGRALRFTGVNMDISARKKAELEVRLLNSELEQRVRQRTAQLETANKEMEAFAYSVAHDLRAPLRGIDGWSLALVEDYAGGLDDRAKGYIECVRSETQRMGLLIDDMLKLSRVTRGEMQFRPVDLTAIAQNIATGLLETNPGRHIQFVIEPGLLALGDARLLEIALMNLLANAVKFTGPREVGRIEFVQTSHNGQQAFCVRDNGVGFDMAYSSSLFRAFQRLHKPTEFPGTGVGLATVQRVIRRHSGQVWAEAQVDRGATFYFTIGETA
jgi:PAS domain S-box-containing protein